MNHLLRGVISGLIVMSLLIANVYSAAVTRATPVINGLNEFAFDLYKQVVMKEENAILSPYSVSSLLGLLVEGAAGETANQILQQLHLDENQDLPRLAKELAALDRSLNGSSICDGWLRCQLNKWVMPNKTTLAFTVANALWADGSFMYKKSFLDVMALNKTVHFETVNFVKAPEQARRQINRWAAKNTQGNIKDLVPSGSVTIDTRLVLTNALYFKGLWKTPFKREETQLKPFTLAEGKTVNTPMMQQQATFFYAENDQLQMLQLPYANSPLVMAILLPKAKHALPAIQAMLNADFFSQLLQESYRQEVIVSLPPFMIESTMDKLSVALQRLGLSDAFNEKANFSNMTDDALMISAVIQKAMIKVDEEGTVATAATATLVAGTAYMPPVTFAANHPFIFIIYDTQSKVVLFIGQVVSPQ